MNIGYALATLRDEAPLHAASTPAMEAAFAAAHNNDVREFNESMKCTQRPGLQRPIVVVLSGRSAIGGNLFLCSKWVSGKKIIHKVKGVRSAIEKMGKKSPHKVKQLHTIAHSSTQFVCTPARLPKLNCLNSHLFFRDPPFSITLAYWMSLIPFVSFENKRRASSALCKDFPFGIQFLFYSCLPTDSEFEDQAFWC
jgi:hypothetical protein